MMYAKLTRRNDETLAFNGNATGYFLSGTGTILDGMFMGRTRNEISEGLTEINNNRYKLNLPLITPVLPRA